MKTLNKTREHEHVEEYLTREVNKAETISAMLDKMVKLLSSSITEKKINEYVSLSREAAELLPPNEADILQSAGEVVGLIYEQPNRGLRQFMKRKIREELIPSLRHLRGEIMRLHAKRDDFNGGYSLDDEASSMLDNVLAG